MIGAGDQPSGRPRIYPVDVIFSLLVFFGGHVESESKATGSVCIHPVICNPMMIKRQESVLCTSKKHYHRLSDSVPRGGEKPPPNQRKS